MHGRNDNPGSATAAVRLRLVGTEAVGPTARVRPDSPQQVAANGRARRDVARENRSASMLTDADARVVFAQQVAQAIEGGQAAILRPERRQSLVTRATGMGLRAFDANLIIAIVQDAARRGEEAGRVVASSKPSLAMVGSTGVDSPTAGKAPGRDAVIRFAVIAVGIGLCLLGGLIAWLRG